MISLLPTKYEVVIDGQERIPGHAIYIETRDDRGPVEGWKWCITSGRGTTLNSDLEWEWEPLPSSRDEAYLARTRFSLADARELVARLAAL